MDTKELERFCPWAREELVGAVGRGMVQLGVNAAGRAQWPAGSEAVAGRALSPAEREARDAALARIGDAGDDAAFAEREAYSWFNRLMALRYMELHGLLPWGGRALSAADGSFEPELARRAADLPLARLDRAAYLDRVAASDDEGAFRLALEAACAELAPALPGVFAGASCALLPKGLLSRGEHGVIRRLVEDVPEGAWEGVEALGWAYQFYNSELHRKFYDGKGKASKEDLPAATQLFTPDWIVRYMVQNTLGRLWMLNNPQSPLREQMEFYIEPEAGHEDFLRVGGPEEITFLDPACGSGHILVYAFRLLTEMYRERGWRDRDIARSILEKNLSGYEIDPRAAQIAQTALCMEALALDRRWLARGVEADVRVLGDIRIPNGELLGRPGLADTLAHLGECGSLLSPSAEDLAALEMARGASYATNLFEERGAEAIEEAADACRALARTFSCVVANPPYLGSSKFNAWMAKWIKKSYPDTCRDLFSAFIERICSLADPHGEAGVMCPFVWMFIGSYEKLRDKMIGERTLTSLIQLEYSGFEGATVPICTFTLHNSPIEGYKGGYVRLSDFTGAKLQAPKAIEAIKNPGCGWFYRADASTFRDIPGSPIAYWASEAMHEAFRRGDCLAHHAIARDGIHTCNNDRFLRRWWEVDLNKSSLPPSHAPSSEIKKWFAYNKGGYFRKWRGNDEYVINWENEGSELKSSPKAHGFNGSYAFKPSVSWSSVSSGKPAFRQKPSGHMFDAAGYSMFPAPPLSESCLCAFANSTIAENMLSFLSPTLNYQAGDILSMPLISIPPCSMNQIETQSDACISISQIDWDSQETSWDFKRNPLI